MNDRDNFRKEHVELTEVQKEQIAQIKIIAEHMQMRFKFYNNREMSIALTKLEEAVMWGVKGVTSITNITRDVLKNE